jgi:hypothetical protein
MPGFPAQRWTSVAIFLSPLAGPRNLDLPIGLVALRQLVNPRQAAQSHGSERLSRDDCERTHGTIRAVPAPGTRRLLSSTQRGRQDGWGQSNGDLMRRRAKASMRTSGSRSTKWPRPDLHYINVNTIIDRAIAANALQDREHSKKHIREIRKRQTMALTDFEFDREETVEWVGVGRLPLRTAVRRVMAAPPANRRLITLYRDAGKEPAFFALIQIE